MPVFLAVFWVWLDGVYGNIIWIMYFIVSFNLFYFLNTDKNRAAHYLLLPASTTEKIIAHLIQAIGIPTAILIITLPAMIFFQGMINLHAGESMLSYMPVLKELTVNNFLVALLLQAVSGFSVLVFKKMTGIKTIIVITAVFVVVRIFLKIEGIMEGITIFLFNGILLCLTIGVWIANHYKLRKIEV
jgi:hypothetical protein